MNLKTSLSKGPVSRAILLSNLRTHWVWPCIMGILLCFNVLAVRELDIPTERSTAFVNWFIVSYIFGIMYAVLVSLKLFLYLDKPNSVSFMHGIPVSRLKLYITNILSGGILIAIPPFAASVLMIISQVSRASVAFRLYSILSFLGIYLCYSLIAFAITTFAMTFCGNVIVSLLLTFGIAVLPAAVTGFCVGVCYKNLYGYIPNNGLEAFLNKLYIVPTSILTPDCLVYIIGGIVLLGLGLWIYMIRPLENCGEVVVFSRLRMLFTVTVGVVLGMISYLFFAGVFGTDSVLWMLPLGLVGVIGANMIARKTVGLRGSGIHIGVYVALTLLVSLSFSYDWFGYVHRVPDLADIKSVVVTTDRDATARITDPSEIAAVCALHKAVTEQAGEEMEIDYKWDDPTDYRYYTLSFTYTLRNGLTLRRSYDYLKQENAARYLEPLLNTKTMKMAVYSVLADGVTPVEATLFDNRIVEPAVSYGKEQAEKLIEALRRDVESHTAEELEADDSDLYVRFGYYSEYEPLPNSRSYSDDEKSGKRMYYYALHYNRNYTNLIAAIADLRYDIYNEKQFAKIDELTIRLCDYSEDVMMAEDYVVTDGIYPETVETYSGNFGSIISVIRDRETLRKYYDGCGFGWNGSQNFEGHYATFEFTFIDTDTDDENKRIVYSESLTIAEKNMPDALKECVREALAQPSEKEETE